MDTESVHTEVFIYHAYDAVCSNFLLSNCFNMNYFTTERPYSDTLGSLNRNASNTRSHTASIDDSMINRIQE